MTIHVETPEASNRIDNNRVFHDLLQLYGDSSHRRFSRSRRLPESLSDTEAEVRHIPGPAPGPGQPPDRRYNRLPSTRRRRRFKRMVNESGDEAEVSDAQSEADDVSDSGFSCHSTVSAPIFSKQPRREPRRAPDLLAMPDLLVPPPAGHSSTSLKALAKSLEQSSCPSSSSSSSRSSFSSSSSSPVAPSPAAAAAVVVADGNVQPEPESKG